jgi:ferredoxin
MVWVIIGSIIGFILIMVLLLWLIGERWHLLRKSSWQSLKEYRPKDILNLKPLHMYVYGRWTARYIYILRVFIYPLLGEKGKTRLRNNYHSKILTQENAESIVTLNESIPLQDLEQVIPYPTARDIVLNGPPDIVVYECGCRNSRPNPCQPTQVCMVVGKPFTDFVIDHLPEKSRRLSQEEALQLLRDEHERGHIHTAWFKDVCLDRFYAICNCCKCCCFGIEAMMKYGNPVIASSGYVSQVDENLCIACGECVDACPFNALSVNDNKLILNWDNCMGCGACEVLCPSNAISLVRDERKGIPLDVTTLV